MLTGIEISTHPRGAYAKSEHDQVEPACIDDLGSRRSQRVARRGRTFDLGARAVEQRVIEVAHKPAGPVAHHRGDDDVRRGSQQR